MPLKPLDLVVCLELAAGGSPDRTYQELARAVGLSASETNRAVQRAVEAGLLLPAEDRAQKPRPHARALLEFLEHGVRYAFAAVPGKVVRGTPTAHSAPPLSGRIQPGEELPLVWPDPRGTHRGQAVEPLYATVPEVARRNPRLYELLALTDALRCGGARERKLALEELERRILDEPASDPNLAQLEQVAQRLGDLLDELTLVGGCAAGLLITDPGAAPVRPTYDVDLVIEARTYMEYEAFARRLERVGLRRAAQAGEPLCRWRVGDLVLDVMPLEERVLGFANRWYASAIKSRIARRLPNDRVVHHIDAPHFLATKLEAYRSRGAGDPLTSHDLEDLVRVVDGRASVESELAGATPELREFVGAELASCLDDRFFVEALPEHFATHDEGLARSRMLVERLRRLASDA